MRLSLHEPAHPAGQHCCPEAPGSEAPGRRLRCGATLRLVWWRLAGFGPGSELTEPWSALRLGLERVVRMCCVRCASPLTSRGPMYGRTVLIWLHPPAVMSLPGPCGRCQCLVISLLHGLPLTPRSPQCPPYHPVPPLIGPVESSGPLRGVTVHSNQKYHKCQTEFYLNPAFSSTTCAHIWVAMNSEAMKLSLSLSHIYL